MFAHDTELELVVAAALINTLLDGTDRLSTPAELDKFLSVHPFTGTLTHDVAELAGVREFRQQLRELWLIQDRAQAAAIVNQMLVTARALPQLAIHDHQDWHIHATSMDAPLAQRMRAEAAMAFVDLIRTDNLDRLRICAADDCSAALVDFSRNRSRRFCDTGNCANRMHVAAYRARKSGALARKQLPGQ